MDLDPMIASLQEDYFYSGYDNRSIRSMNQEALNETLAGLPILIDEEYYNNRTNDSSDPNTKYRNLYIFFSLFSIMLFYCKSSIKKLSTRGKNLPTSTSAINNNQSLLHVSTTIGTPKSDRCISTVIASTDNIITLFFRTWWLSRISIIKRSTHFSNLLINLFLCFLD
jgi:hypothetical protein